MSSKQPPPRRLGRGLSSLISGELTAHRPPVAETDSIRGDQTPAISAKPGVEAVAPSPAEVEPATDQALSPGRGYRLANLKLDMIRANPLQPRRVFEEAKLAELANSIRTRGNLQPIVVRPSDAGYELVAGERRLRATRLAGLAEIPAIIRSVADDQMLELALIENIQRADLNPVERARGYRLLAEKYHLTHEQVAERVGEDRATVSNYLRILTLGEDILPLLESGELSSAHAKLLLSIADNRARHAMAQQVVNEGWSVRRLEQELARSPGSGASDRNNEKKESKRPDVAELEERIRTTIGVRATIQEGRRRHTGKIVLQYYSLDDFDRIVRRLGVPIEEV
ncbi:MAG: ParB/RepB/Spo0J family partition protein [Phycisphaerae bacterium]|nr:ParB/RepB/Spo0J family partition protein [Phycisphaerae bacterium]